MKPTRVMGIGKPYSNIQRCLPKMSIIFSLIEPSKITSQGSQDKLYAKQYEKITWKQLLQQPVHIMYNYVLLPGTSVDHCRLSQ